MKSEAQETPPTRLVIQATAADVHKGYVELRADGTQKLAQSPSTNAIGTVNLGQESMGVGRTRRKYIICMYE